jgi:hypothetical protein
MDMKEEIEVPAEFVEFAKVWHDGQWSSLYSVASTGRIRMSDMFNLYSEIEPAAVYDAIGESSGVEYADFETSNRFVLWSDLYLTDEWWEEKEKS